ncbi:MAG TPA: hypothetical protein VHK27_15580 [Gammaproteobacteria bacterium]|nr:hypothetical protein [Gammaproteobacteria bacterium]
MSDLLVPPDAGNFNPFRIAADILDPPENRWLYNPVQWARDVITWDNGSFLADYQQDILNALVEHRRVSARGPHGLGKSAISAIAILWFATTRDAASIDWKVVSTASAWRHLKDYLWPEIHKWSGKINWEVLGRPEFSRYELLDLRIKLRFGAATAAASDTPENIEGAHADSLLYVYDESKTIRSETWDAVEGAFSGARETGLPEAFALSVSTPGKKSGRFFDIQARKPGFEDWYVRHVRIDEAIAAGRISEHWIEQRKKQWGEKSSIFINRALGEFHSGDEDSVVPLDWIEAAVERWHEWDREGRPEIHGRTYLGVDVARSGTDSTVFLLRTGPLVSEIETDSKLDTMQAVARIQVKLNEIRATPVVDTIGVGGGVVDRLRELGIKVVSYTGNAATKRRERSRAFGFTNTRSAAYWNLRELLDPAFDSDLMLPPNEQMLADLSAPQWEYTSGNPPKIKVEPKEDVIKRLGHSPDIGDAVVMAFWEGSTAATVMTPARARERAAQRRSTGGRRTRVGKQLSRKIFA